MRRSHRRAHVAIWILLAAILPVALAGAAALRGADADGPAAVRLPDDGSGG